MRQQSDWQAVTSGGNEMRLFVARPEAARAPGIIVLQEAFGVNAHIRAVTERIASLGYVAVAPELFHRTAPGFEGDYDDLGKSKPHMAALANDKIEEDMRAAYGWLQADGQVERERVTAVGYCLGGKAAFIANAALPLKVAVSYYGSSIPSLLEEYAGRQRAPLLLFWGGQDKHIDAEGRTRVAEALRSAGKVFTQVEFSDAGHGFFCDARNTYHSDAARESWAMLAVFLKDRL